jgi:hypothetical protein
MVPVDGRSFLAVHNILILFAARQTEYYHRSRRFIRRATYLRER